MGILLAAVIATVASVLMIGGIIVWRSAPAERRILALLFVLQLPISPLTMYGIKFPLDCLSELWIPDKATRDLLSVFYRALIEELAKLWPLLLPSVWRTMTADTKILRGLAIGLGFGVGEIWLNAEIVYRNMPDIANLPVLDLVGFINERIMVCGIHGVQTMIALQSLVWGPPLAIAMHSLANLPIYLKDIAAFGLSAGTWMVIVRAWILWYFFALMFVAFSMAGGDLHIVWLLFGDATCPYCGMIYPRATLTWSLRVIHYDHCPRCKRRNVMHI